MNRTETQTARFGVRHAFSPDSILLSSFIYQDVYQSVRENAIPRVAIDVYRRTLGLKVLLARSFNICFVPIILISRAASDTRNQMERLTSVRRRSYPYPLLSILVALRSVLRAIRISSTPTFTLFVRQCLEERDVYTRGQRRLRERRLRNLKTASVQPEIRNYLESISSDNGSRRCFQGFEAKVNY